MNRELFSVNKKLNKAFYFLVCISVLSFCTPYTTAQTNPYNRIILQGEPGSGFGHQVCSGDFNGDNVDDIVVTSFSYSGGSETLAISIFWGSRNINTQPDVIINLPDTATYYVIANAGDINSDGYDDIIVGLPYWNNRTGKVIIFFGGDPMDPENNLILEGQEEYSYFGAAVSSAGDFNGDGFSDFMIQLPSNSYIQNDRSVVYLYYGSNNIDTIPDLIFTSLGIYDDFGSSIHCVGDVNGDGFDDILIGAKWNYNKVFIYLGSENPDTTADYTITSINYYGRFGFSACGEIDLNQDGYDDIIISAYRSNVNNYEEGKAYIYLGGDPMSTQPALTLNGIGSFEHFGYKVCGIGYFNEDIYPDFVIGAPGGGNALQGKAYVYYGGESLSDVPAFELTDEYSAMFSFGTTIASGDFNDDGLSEFLIGNLTDPEYLENQQLYGDKAYLYYYVPPAYKIQYSASNIIFESDYSFTFDVYIKNNGTVPWQYCNGQLTFRFYQNILSYGSLLWSIVPGFSDFPVEQQPDSAVVYSFNTIGTMLTEPFEGYYFSPGEKIRYGRFRIQSTDTTVSIAPFSLQFLRTGQNKTISSRWVWYDSLGKYFNNENITYIDLEPVVVPVELTVFNATVNQTNVLLDWQTQTELNNNGFEVQRKLENSEWITIGFVQGNGTTTETKSYTYLDDISEITATKIYYRLKQIDFNGNYEFSKEVEVIVLPYNYSLSQNYPNPFNPTTKISWQSPISSWQTLKIYDMLGNEVAILVNEYRPAGNYEVEFSGSDLPSGVYFYQLKAGSFIQTKKMILLR